MNALNMFCMYLLTSTIALAQQEVFTGAWKLVDFKMVMEENTNHMDEATLTKEGAVWDLIFREDGSLTQTSNMRNGETESWEGRYEIKEDGISLFLMVEGREMQLQYQYEFRDSLLHLKRSNPMGTLQILTQFKKA